MTRISGVNMENAEDLEVIEYRPGGFHVPHVDYYESTEELEQENNGYGNR